MGKTILGAFVHPFDKEAAYLGRLLAGYTNLEVGLMNSVQIVRDDFDTVLKSMFRARGETARIDVADAFGRHHYHQQALGTEFEMAIGAVRYCLRIRNEYAHCVWYNDQSGTLAFANLEEIAKGNAYLRNLDDLSIFHVDEALPAEQEAYFVYTDELIAWVNYEGRYRVGKISVNPLTKPRQPTRPTLHLR
jgi:hypothetical protein